VLCVSHIPSGAIGRRDSDSESDPAIAPDLDVVDFHTLRAIRRAEVEALGRNRGIQLIDRAESLNVHGFLEGTEKAFQGGIRGAWNDVPEDQISLASLNRHPANDLLLCIEEMHVFSIA
jgi:hypothetical protein